MPESSTGPASARQWLSADETEAWKAVAAIAMLLPGALDGQLQRDAGINLFEYLVMSELSIAPHRTLRMSGLARIANGSLSRLSNVVKRLERHGWVRRDVDPDDRRITTATLTDAGWNLVVAAAPGHVEEVRRLVIDPLTAAQLRSITAAGERIRIRLQEGNGKRPPRSPHRAR
jgi:DNA-binding MarR family transcriptional regulator